MSLFRYSWDNFPGQEGPSKFTVMAKNTIKVAGKEVTEKFHVGHDAVNGLEILDAPELDFITKHEVNGKQVYQILLAPIESNVSFKSHPLDYRLEQFLDRSDPTTLLEYLETNFGISKPEYNGGAISSLLSETEHFTLKIHGVRDHNRMNLLLLYFPNGK